jgi:2-dehydropantoate 2-reductase
VVDVVIVLVKSFHTREAMASSTALVGPQTVVISLQNGLGHEAVLADVVGAGRVMAGKTYVGGTVLGRGHVLAGTAGKETLIGELDGRLTDRALRIGRALNEAGLTTTVSDRIVGVMWDKLLVNVATGALSGITRLTYGDLYQVPEIAATAQAAVAEAMAVAAAMGIVLSVDRPHQPWDKAAQGLPAAFKTSLLQSLEKGSPTEIDFINGAVCRHGRRCGVPTPVNDTLVAAVKGLERGLRPTAQPLQETHSS